MAVPEQLPIVSYTANGETTNFAITFDLHNPNALRVMRNKELVSSEHYTIVDGAVSFNTAPVMGDEITLIRDTDLDRETTFQTYDNSFRPEALNWDFDKLWHVLQEQNLVDAKVLARLKDEIEWRRTHDFNFDELAKVREAQIFGGLKQYVDTYIGATNPNIFGGVTASIVFAQDGKSLQTYLNQVLDQLDLNRINIEKRAELAYVQAELNTKASLETTDKLQNTKADFEYVNSMINVASEGTIPFLTQEQLLESSPDKEKVLGKALDTKKVWLWEKPNFDGATGNWTDTGLSELDLAINFTNEKADEIKNELDSLSTFTDVDDEKYEYAITDKNGNVALGIEKDGAVSSKSLKTESILISENSILQIDNSNFEYAIADKNGNIAFGIKKDGSIYPNFEAQKNEDINLLAQKTDWIHGHTYGQSLSRGSGSYPVVSTTQPYNNLTFASGVLPRLSDTHDYSATKPLVEQRWNSTSAEGESPTSGMLNKITELSLKDGNQLTFFGASSGQGGTRLELLSKGTTRYNEQLEMYKAAYALAQNKGLSYSVGVIGFVQGESNYNADTSRSDYKTMEVQLKRDFDADIRLITNQDFPPIMVTYQTASHFVASTRRNHTNIALAQWDAHRENIDIVMACSMYSIEYLADNLHLTADSSLQLGKYLGKAAYKTIQHAKGLSDKPFAPLEPIHAIWQGKIIDITFNVPEGNLTLDTTLVSQTHNYGFDIWVDDVVQENAIENVSIVDKNRVRIVLNQAYENAILSYARGRPSDPVASGPVNGPRGNLRDQAGEMDNYLDSKGVKRYMHNWCVIFQYSKLKGFN